mmetsp:Transcript_103365/g.202691  ORF Transcript_103365/g.202691 Transcript_103365/m.202691 type:complete len:188 (+) Transcript_103365:78-641(+)
MASRGDGETQKLRQNIEDQLKRLLTQLQDIEEMKQDMDEEEYESTRKETIDQLKEFEISLEKMSSGNISLVDSIGSVQLAIQAAIRSTTSPEILNMFLKKENGALRTKLAGLDSDRILGRITQDAYESQAIDIVKMLEKLGEALNPKEQELLNKDKQTLGNYTRVSAEIGNSAMETATKEIGLANSK